MIKVGIVGATGYTGVELLRLLHLHPEVEVTAVTSRAEAGRRVDAIFPSLRGAYALEFVTPDADYLAQHCEVVFYATPHATAMHHAGALLERGVKVIDLSADFRLDDLQQWAKWYGQAHAAPELMQHAVYGLPEVNRSAIEQADLIACPGCYPTAVQLGFLPLLENRLVDTQQLVADCKSGVSGAGRKAAIGALLCEAGDSMQAYGLGGHRHQPEIEQGLSAMAAEAVDLCFVPHLTPMIRGIQATLYANLTQAVDLQALYESRYADEVFVDVLPAGDSPSTRSVRGSNFCRIAVHQLSAQKVVVLVAVDNLVKGAAGQAIQCMNIRLGMPEQAGLETLALMP